MLVYLGEKTGQFLPPPSQPRERADVMQWLFWQMGGLGPMSGQNNHFSRYAVDKLPYAIERYNKEVNRLYGVMNKRLADRPFLAGEYSIADMASYPWVVPHEAQGQNQIFLFAQNAYAASKKRVKGIRASVLRPMTWFNAEELWLEDGK